MPFAYSRSSTSTVVGEFGTRPISIASSAALSEVIACFEWRITVASGTSFASGNAPRNSGTARSGLAHCKSESNFDNEA